MNAFKQAFFTDRLELGEDVNLRRLAGKEEHHIVSQSPHTVQLDRHKQNTSVHMKNHELDSL